MAQNHTQTTTNFCKLTKLGKTKAPYPAKDMGLLKAACVQVLMLFCYSIPRLTGGTTHADCTDPKLQQSYPGLGYSGVRYQQVRLVLVQLLSPPHFLRLWALSGASVPALAPAFNDLGSGAQFAISTTQGPFNDNPCRVI